MDSKLLVGLIKEVVQREVKQQVKEELAKMIKSGAVTLNSQKKTTSPTLREMTEIAAQPVRKQQPIQQQRPQQMKEYTSNPMLNEVLNMTTPFSAEQRTDVGMMEENSILDMMQPTQYEEDGWDTMDYRMNSVPQNIPSTGNAGLDAIQKALSRDYSDLTKVFSQQEKDKGLR